MMDDEIQEEELTDDILNEFADEELEEDEKY